MHHFPHNGKEARRVQAWQLKPHGWPQRQIAAALGVSEAAISQWMARARRGGMEALRRRPSPGARRRLPADHLAQLPNLLQRRPAAYGFRGQLWTRGRIAAVIRLEFGLSSHPRQGGRWGEAIRWSPQKPARRARQRDEAAMAPWRQETWPALTRGRTPRSTPSSSSMSPAVTPGRVARPDAPGGQTPILREWWPHDHLSAIGAIAPEGKLYCRGQDHPINATEVVACLEPLVREVAGQVVISWDGAPIHRRRVMHECLARGAAQRRHLARLPAYAPELNPGEGLWAQLKGVALRHLCGFTIPHLRHDLRNAVNRVRRKPRLIQSFFRGAKL